MMSIPVERRNFLKNITVLGAATTVAVTVPNSIAAIVEQPAQEAIQSKGYHVTEHIRAYYRTLAQ